MSILLIAGICAVLAAGAVAAYLAGELLRIEQARRMEAYLAEAREAVRRRRTAEAVSKAEPGRQSPRTIEPLPRDEALSRDLEFVKRIAKDNPRVFATVVKRYVRGDPAVLSGKKRPTDFAALEDHDLS